MIIQVEPCGFRLPTDAAIEINGIGFGFITPPIFCKIIQISIPGNCAIVATALEISDRPPEGAGAEFDTGSLETESIFHIDSQGATKAIESKQRIGTAAESNALNRRLGQQIPVNGIAQWLINANTILIDCNSLSQTQQRRCSETAILKIRLQGIALSIIQSDATKTLSKKVGNTQRIDSFEVSGIGDLHGERNLVPIHAGAGGDYAHNYDLFRILGQDRGRDNCGNQAAQSTTHKSLRLDDSKTRLSRPRGSIANGGCGCN